MSKKRNRRKLTAEQKAARNANPSCCHRDRTCVRAAIVAVPPSVIALTAKIGGPKPCSRGRMDFSSMTIVNGVCVEDV